MLRMRSSVAIHQESVRAEVVVVRPFPALDDRRGGDAEWQLWQDHGLEDTLRAQERHALPLEDEALRQQCPRQGVAVEDGLSVGRRGLRF
jgi:hypothetical protein